MISYALYIYGYGGLRAHSCMEIGANTIQQVSLSESEWGVKHKRSFIRFMIYSRIHRSQSNPEQPRRDTQRDHRSTAGTYPAPAPPTPTIHSRTGRHIDVRAVPKSELFPTRAHASTNKPRSLSELFPTHAHTSPSLPTERDGDMRRGTPRAQPCQVKSGPGASCLASSQAAPRYPLDGHQAAAPGRSRRERRPPAPAR